ncbi:MAG TPA: hypothetical protein VGE08_11345 [Steroidobacter sp.]|uniref:hypothetical protein n=1 Tax=Steroidobacter sp. TaxID=1978227 RepID=UPI002ED9C0B2
MQVVQKAVLCPIVLIVLGISLLMRADVSGAQTAVYRCAGEQGVVYSDVPCDEAASVHEIDDSRITVYTPLEITSGPAPAAVPAKQTKGRRIKPGPAAGRDAHRIMCAKLDQRLRDVRTKMRAGYGVEEGERLKARHRQLNEQRRAERCG